MITFLTPTELPIEAATTMGVSVKESDNAIGKFGTGLKYAIAGVLRLGGSITIWLRGEAHKFTAEGSTIRGRAFRIVHCNGAPCGFTTELGKHWEPWQLFRELASNTLDEGGSWVHHEAKPSEAATVIQVKCREVERAETEEHVFLSDRTPLVTSSNGATFYAGHSNHFYYKGIRAGSFDSVAPVTVDISKGDLSEDRLLDTGRVMVEIAYAFRTAITWDANLLLSVIASDRPDDFWIRNINPYMMDSVSLPGPMMDFILERPKFVQHPVFSKILKNYLRTNGFDRWAEIPTTAKHMALLAEGESLCETVGVDPIPRAKVHFTQDLDDSTLAVTCMDTRHVWFSTKLALRGRDEFLCGYLEEALHAMTGHSDCTREFQNVMLSMIVSLGLKEVA